MENYKLVLPEHLNHYGYLFGGNLLKWVDEVSWIAASLDYPGSVLVTIGMDKVEFKKSIKEGSVLKFDINRSRIGTTSVQYSVQAFCDDIESGNTEEAFSTHITFVSLDDEGKKKPLLEKEKNEGR